MLCPSGKFAEALRQFELALDACGGDSFDFAKLYSNVSAALFELHSYEQAAEAAAQAIELQPAWDKAYLRKFQALVSLKQYSAAMQAVQAGLVHDTSSISLNKAKHILQDLPSSYLQPLKQARCSAPNEVFRAVEEPAVGKLRQAGQQPHTAAMSCTLRPREAKSA